MTKDDVDAITTKEEADAARIVLDAELAAAEFDLKKKMTIASESYSEQNRQAAYDASVTLADLQTVSGLLYNKSESLGP